jgi:hypothetical protein
MRQGYRWDDSGRPEGAPSSLAEAADSYSPVSLRLFGHMILTVAVKP